MDCTRTVEVLKEFIKFILLVILWALLLGLLVLLLPFLAMAFLLRTSEACMYRYKYNAETLPSEDVLYTMTKPENRMIIAGFLQVDGEMTINRLRSLVQQNLIDRVDENNQKLYPKATKHVYPGFINYYWQDDACFEIEQHVYAQTENPVESEKELKLLIGNHCSKPLRNEIKQSPWEFVLIPYMNSGGIRKTIIMYKLAHVIADGSALAYFLLNFLADNTKVHSTGSMVKKYSEVNRMLLTLKGFWQLPLAYLRLTMMTSDRNTLHSSQLSGQKHVTWSKPLDLKDIKNVKNSLHTTVNDVLVGNFAKSLHDYFEMHELNNTTSKRKHLQTFSAILAVDTRSSVLEAEHFENHVVGAVIPLSTAPSDIFASIKDTKKTMDNLKHTGVPMSIHFGWKYISYLLPAFLAKLFVYNMVDKTTAIISNIMGPQYEISIDGHPVEFMTFWPPQTNNETVGVSFCSYDGNVRVGLQIDSAVILDPHEILTIYEKNLQQLITKVNTLKIVHQ